MAFATSHRWTRHPARWLAMLALASLLLFGACTDDNSGDNGAEPTVRAAQGTARSGTATPRALSDADRMALQANIGSSVDQSVLDRIDIDVRPDGAGLPDGRGTVQAGQQLYASMCAACHGIDGKAGTGFVGPALVGAPGPWKPGMPKTIGSYWPYSTTVYDYIRRAMPFNAPGSLTDEQVYAVTAWLLNQSQIIPADAEMNRDSLPKVQMPNRDNFDQCWPDQCRPDLGR